MITTQSKCFNISRKAAQLFTGTGLSNVEATLAWISIVDLNEPDASNNILDKCPKLKLKFYDVEEICFDGPNNIFAKQIVNFIIKNNNRDFMINCMMGWSRSGAICKFLESHFNYKWPEEFKINSDPNNTLYNLLIDEYSNTVLSSFKSA